MTEPAGRLLSVNVGMPRDIEWEGRTVQTGIWKAPAAGARMVRRLNVDGDGQGDLPGHGAPDRAVFVYQVDSYRCGENFTVDGLPDDGACIGDRYRIGGLSSRSANPVSPATASACG